MNMKKTALIGIVVLVAFGCIAAAGCVNASDMNEKVIGSWSATADNLVTGSSYTYTETFEIDGTGFEVCIKPDGEEVLTNFTWEIDGPITSFGVVYKVICTYEDGNTGNFYYNFKTDAITEEDGPRFTRADVRE